MTDPRVTPNNGRVAHVSLEGVAEAERFVEGRWMSVQQPIVNLTDTPRGNRTTQLLFGERFLVLDEEDGLVFGQCEKDGYVGYLAAGALAPAEVATHWITAPATHLYPRPDFKAPPDVSLFFGARVTVTGEERNGYHRISTGHFIPAQHAMPVRATFADPLGVADLFLGTPYLWGGSSRWGLDCSGLVQMAFLACGVDCPRDSDQQEDSLGEFLGPEDVLQRNDLVFWEGHVGMMANETMLLHANAHHMAVAYEPLAEARARIADREFGPITARKRVQIGR